METSLCSNCERNQPQYHIKCKKASTEPPILACPDHIEVKQESKKPKNSM